MAYEIPLQLQHKERILFGLTFGQIGWALLFGLFILGIVSSSASFTTKFTLSLFPGLLAILFMFFDLASWIKRVFIFAKFREAIIGSAKMESIVQVKRIENDSLKTSSEVALLQIEPINFSIKTPEEQDAIISGFQKFLNGLDFPVQFVVTTQNLNIDEYLEKMEKNAVDKTLFNDFSSFIKQLITDQQMRNRLFFLVIPKSSNLHIQATVCEERLKSIGLKTIRVKDKQLITHLRTFFNDVLEPKDSNEPLDGLQYLIAPNNVVDKIDSLQINDKYCRIISASGYPRMVESGFLDKIISSNDDFDISLHIEPFSIESMMVLLNRELQKQRADLYAEEKKRSINPTLELKYKDTLKVLEEMQKGNEKLFNVSLYINCKAKTKEELNLLTKKVEAELNSLMIVPKNPYFRQIDAYRSMVPVAKDHLKTTRNITTKALSAFFPFTSPFLTLEEKGVMMGLNKNKVPYIKDIYSLSNANGVVLATSGSGKSYFTKLLIARQLLNNTKVIVIDPQGEYKGLVQEAKGELITISRNSETTINPLDLMGHEFIEKRLALMDLFKIMFGELSEVQKSILDKAINETYARFKITIDSYKHKKPPLLSDLYKTLIDMDKKAAQSEKITYRALINRLYMYSEGVFSFMNRQSSINFDSNFVCFNIGEMPKQVKPVIMFLILDYVYLKMKQGKERKLLVVDEAWSLLSRAEEAGYIFEIVKTCRKFNLGLLLITQDVADLVNSKAGGAVLANSAYTFLLRQKPAIINQVVKTFNLSQNEKEQLLTATQGKGILILDNEHQELEVIASPKEHKLITTNPNEDIIKKTKKEEKEEATPITLDTDKGLYYGKNIDVEEKNYLRNHGYVVTSRVPIGKKNQEQVWVKTNKVESIEHTFLVLNIKEEIEKYTSKVEVAIVEKPDLLFKNKKGEEIAIEVETGKGFTKHRKRLENKFIETKAKHGKNLYIILTDKDYRNRYEKIAPDTTILLRSDIPTMLSNQFSNKKKKQLTGKKLGRTSPKTRVLKDLRPDDGRTKTTNMDLIK